MGNIEKFIDNFLGPLLMGLTAWGATPLIDLSTFNPTGSFLWTTPALVVLLFRGGITFF